VNKDEYKSLKQAPIVCTVRDLVSCPCFLLCFNYDRNEKKSHEQCIRLHHTTLSKST